MRAGGDRFRWEKLQSVADLVEIAGRMASSTVLIAGGDRADDLKLVESARDHGIIDRIILVGRKSRIRTAVEEVGIDIPAGDVVGASSDDEVASETVRLIKSESVNIVLKGNISTPVINRHMIPLAVRPTVSLASVFDAAPFAGGRPMLLTDAGVTTVCTFGRMVDLIQNAVEVAHVVMGIARPRVAVLSANEKQIPSLPSTWIGEKLALRSWEDAVVYGPLSFDLATDPQSVAIKGLPDNPGAREVAGRADVLVCPGIDSANILYKAVSAMCKFGEASIAGVTVGFPVPYIILSRADSLDTRLQSIALCSIYAQRKLIEKKANRNGTGAGASPSYRVLCLREEGGSVGAALFENAQCISSRQFQSPAVRSREESAPPLATVKPLSRLSYDLKGWVSENRAIAGIHAVAAAAGIASPSAAPDGSGTTGISLQAAEVTSCPNGVVAAGGNPVLDAAAEIAASFGIPLFCTPSSLALPPAPTEREAAGETTPVPVLSIRGCVRKAAAQARRPASDLNLVIAQLDSPTCVAAVVKGVLSACSFVFPDEPLSSHRAVEPYVQRLAGEIGRMFVSAGCDVEAVVIAGRLAESERIRSSIRLAVGRLAPLQVAGGDLELETLAAWAVEQLSGHPGGRTRGERRDHSLEEKRT